MTKRSCPFCSEQIDPSASTCPFCGESVSPATAPMARPAGPAPKPHIDPRFASLLMLGISIGVWLVLMLLEYIGLQIMIGVAKSGDVLAAAKVEKIFGISFDDGSIRLLLFLFACPVALHLVRSRWKGIAPRLLAAIVVGAMLGLVLASATKSGGLTLKGFYFFAAILVALLLDAPRIWALLLGAPLGYLMLVLVYTKLALEVPASSGGLTLLRVVFYFAPILLATRELTMLWSWATPAPPAASRFSARQP